MKIVKNVEKDLTMMRKQLPVLDVLKGIIIQKMKIIVSVVMNIVLAVMDPQKMNVLLVNRFILLVQMIIVIQCVEIIVQYVMDSVKSVILVMFFVMNNVS